MDWQRSRGVDGCAGVGGVSEAITCCNAGRSTCSAHPPKDVNLAVAARYDEQRPVVRNHHVLHAVGSLPALQLRA